MSVTCHFSDCYYSDWAWAARFRGGVNVRAAIVDYERLVAGVDETPLFISSVVLSGILVSASCRRGSASTAGAGGRLGRAGGSVGRGPAASGCIHLHHQKYLSSSAALQWRRLGIVWRRTVVPSQALMSKYLRRIPLLRRSAACRPAAAAIAMLESERNIPISSSKRAKRSAANVRRRPSSPAGACASPNHRIIRHQALSPLALVMCLAHIIGGGSVMRVACAPHACVLGSAIFSSRVPRWRRERGPRSPALRHALAVVLASLRAISIEICVFSMRHLLIFCPISAARPIMAAAGSGIMFAANLSCPGVA